MFTLTLSGLKVVKQLTKPQLSVFCLSLCQSQTHLPVGGTGESQSTANNELLFHETVNSLVFSHLSDPEKELIKLTWRTDTEQFTTTLYYYNTIQYNKILYL